MYKTIITLFLIGSVTDPIQQVDAWTKSLQSFSGVYTLQQNTPETGRMSIHPVEYRCQGSDRFLRIAGFDAEESGYEIETGAMFNGSVETSYITNEIVNYGTKNQDPSKWPFPWGAYLTPEQLFGGYRDLLPEEVLSQGDAVVRQIEGNTVVSVPISGRNTAVEFALDDNGAVARIDYVERPTAPKENIIKFYEGTLDELRIVTSSIELAGFSSIDGVNFPSFAQKTWWSLNETALDELEGRLGRGDISEEEWDVLKFAIPVIATATQTFQLDVARLNIPLSAEDFAVEYPEKMNRYDAFWGRIRPQAPWHKDPLSPQFLLIYASVILLIFIFSGYYVYKFR